MGSEKKFEEDLSEQLKDLNESLNAVWRSVQEEEELKDFYEKVRKAFEELRKELEEGTLPGLIGKFFVAYEASRSLMDKAGDSEAGKVLLKNIEAMQRYYLGKGLATTTTPEKPKRDDGKTADDLEKEAADEDRELDQSKRS